MTLQLIPGPIGLQIIRRSPESERARLLLRSFKPRSNLGLAVARALPLLPFDLASEIIEKMKSALIAESSLALAIIRRDGRREELGIVGRKVVTEAGAGYIIDAMQNLVESENMKYHALGTGTTAEAATGAGAAMVTELTTEYTGNVRATGTTTEASAMVYRSVATNTLDGTPGAALREHGLMSASSAGVCFDRTLFAAITLVSGEALQSTYDWTLASGG